MEYLMKIEGIRQLSNGGGAFSNPYLIDNYEKNGVPFGTPFFSWQPEKDSNPHKQSQSLSCYHYTIRLFRSAVLTARIIIAKVMGNVNRNFLEKENFRKQINACEILPDQM